MFAEENRNIFRRMGGRFNEIFKYTTIIKSIKFGSVDSPSLLTLLNLNVPIKKD